MINEARERLVGVWRLTAYQDRSSVEDEWDDTHGVNADGTNRRVIDGECWQTNPDGTWSPDGSRTVCLDGDHNGINVYNITSGHASHVAKGSTAIWLDLHTLLVET